MGPIRELGPAALLKVKAEDVRPLTAKVSTQYIQMKILIHLRSSFYFFILFYFFFYFLLFFSFLPTMLYAFRIFCPRWRIFVHQSHLTVY